MTNEGAPPPQPATPGQPSPPPPPFGGQPPQQFPAEPPKKSRVGLILGIVAGVVLLLCGGGVAAVMAIGAAADDDSRPDVYSEPVDISNRAKDSTPLTAREVFPGKTVTVNERTYTVLETEAITECADAAHGGTVTAVTAADCTQVVRATVKDPSGTYIATLGLANLKDSASANAVRDSAEDPNKGSFVPFKVAGTDAAAFGDKAGFVSAVLTNGHYAQFALVGMADNQQPSMKDPRVDQILADLLKALEDPIDDREF
jgi:hypothetical protein